jgi:hypothetical protein
MYLCVCIKAQFVAALKLRDGVWTILGFNWPLLILGVLDLYFVCFLTILIAFHVFLLMHNLTTCMHWR